MSGPRDVEPGRAAAFRGGETSDDRAPVPTRERLLHAALELTREGGYVAASVAAVAGRAGVATGTLYRHWPSKGDLLAELFRAVCARELDAMRAAAADARDAGAAARVELVLLTFARRALRSPRLAWALIAEPVDPLVEAERLAYRRAYREHLAGLLRDGVARGELAPQDAELVAAMLVGGVGEALVGPTSPLIGDAGARDADDVLAGLRTLIGRTIGAPGAV